MAVAAAEAATSTQAEFAREARIARLAALVLDTIVFGFITAIVNGVYGVTEVTSGYIAGGTSFMTTTTAVAWQWLTLLGILYFAVPEAMFGATPGKHLMRIKIVRRDGGPLTLRDVLIRNILRPVDFLPILYLLGGMLVLATSAAQRLGDLTAGTTVVYRHREGATRSSSPTAHRVLIALLAVAVVASLVFDYFGRPPLVIDSLAKTGQLHPLRDYELGSPSWGFGTVTYPIRQAGSGCAGTITLDWSLSEWHLSSMSVSCL
jgi:uncharacterized RDD family membrane protein YckC